MTALVRIEHDFSVPFPREEVWPILSKTDWINRSLGLPPVEYDIQPLSEGGSAVTARARLLGRELRWQEMPFEWLENEFYRVHRIFHAGPFLEVRMGVDFRPGRDHDTLLHVYSHITPHNVLGSWLARRVLDPKTARDFVNIIKQMGEHLNKRATAPLPKLPVSALHEVPFKTGLGALRAAEQPEDLLANLAEFLHHAPDVELSHIRPFTLARQWQADRWEVLRLCLHATRAGLLNFRWEILCPNCRSTRLPPVSSLAEVPRASHCEVCQIKFDAQFDQSVELKFNVNPSIRSINPQTFCLAGPGGKPHVVAQLLLEAGQRRAWKLPPLTGRYRLRSPQVKEPVKIEPDNAPQSIFQTVVMCHPNHFEVRKEFGKVEDYNVQIFNPNRFPIEVALERLEWSEDILTAALVTNLQEFRELFEAQVISPYEQISVGSQVVVFTDLRGSTAMYNRVGDAPAYGLVRNHFYVLAQAVRDHHGAIVKTIGDAVMAVFSRLDEALAAVQQMHEKLPSANPNPAMNARLVLKSSLHCGPCLAVNANDKLDFFGTTINLGARMVDSCKGDDVIVSDEVYQRPEMQSFLEQIHVRAEAAEITFRGFDNPHKIWRIPMSQQIGLTPFFQARVRQPAPA